MKQELDEESRFALVAYRFERAEKTLEEADLLTENGYSIRGTGTSIRATYHKRLEGIA